MDAVSSTFMITFEGGGQAIAATTGQSLLDAIEKAKAEPALVGCRRGGCGACKVQLVEGEVKLAKMSRAHVSAEEESEGFLLACCAEPKSDVTLRLAPKQMGIKTSVMGT